MKTLLVAMVAALLVMNGCTPTSLASSDYVKWVENSDNELNVSKEVDGFLFQLQYKPVPYIILREHNGVYPGQDEYWKRAAELDGLQYYTLRISSDKDHDLLRAGIHDDNEYYSRLEYFTSVMQDDISLIDGKDTMACVLYHYERNYNLAPFTNILLGFEKNTSTEKSGERTLIVHDQALGIGTIKLSVSEESIKDTPALNDAL